ncbi:hypothetical protein MRB53_038052 [Persea americana]|nr:hypothetical protein MRB53_038052 [Persea americana]
MPAMMRDALHSSSSSPAQSSPCRRSQRTAWPPRCPVPITRHPRPITQPLASAAPTNPRPPDHLAHVIPGGPTSLHAAPESPPRPRHSSTTPCDPSACDPSAKDPTRPKGE